MAKGGSMSAVRAEGQALDVDEWQAFASPEHGGRIFWMHAGTGQRTWAQPLPPMIHVSDFLKADLHAVRPRGMHAQGNDYERICFVCSSTFGSDVPESKTISGAAPTVEDVARTMEQIAAEFMWYPPGFPQKAGLDRIIFCARLHYGGQRRGHVPSFHSRTMYIDCLQQPKRRAVSSFHHELWHFADYTMFGRDYEFNDPEWHGINPPGFQYGKGGAVMRSEDSTSGYMGSANSDSFLNRYSTASAAEDKAEVWAAAMTDMALVESSAALMAKRDLLRKRAAQLHPDMNAQGIWDALRRTQLASKGEDGDWEQYTTESGRPWWFNRVTHEKRWEPPKTSRREGRVLRERPGARDRAASYRRSGDMELMQRESSLSAEPMLMPASASEDGRSSRAYGAPEHAPHRMQTRSSAFTRCLSMCFPCVTGPVERDDDDV